MANAPQRLGRSQSRLCLLRWSHEINLIMVLLMARMMMGGSSLRKLNSFFTFKVCYSGRGHVVNEAEPPLPPPSQFHYSWR